MKSSNPYKVRGVLFGLEILYDILLRPHSMFDLLFDILDLPLKCGNLQVLGHYRHDFFLVS